MNQAKPPTFRVAVGLKLRALRDDGKLQVEAVAAIARHWGLPWTRSVVTQIEQGRRRLWVEEWVVLPAIYSQVLRRTDSNPLGWKDLLPSDGQITLTQEVDCVAEGLGTLIQKTGMMNSDTKESFLWPRKWRQLHELQNVEELGRRLWHPGLVPLEIIQAAIPASRGEAETKAARALGIDAISLSVAAFRLWNKSLTAERDARVVAQSGETASPSRLRALRGHTSRELLGALRALLGQHSIKESSRRKPARKRKAVRK